MHYWSVADVIVVFLVLTLVVGLVLTLSVVTKSDDQIESDRPNQIRAQLLLLLAFVLGVLALVAHRYELSSTVKSMMA